MRRLQRPGPGLQRKPRRDPDRHRGGRRSAWESVWEIVRAIPRGRVMTYGQIAALLGHTISAQAVGWAMHVCPEDVPWHRVLNAAGRCSTSRLGDLPPGLQRAILETEGVEFRLDGSLELARFRHHPGPRRVRLRS